MREGGDHALDNLVLVINVLLWVAGVLLIGAVIAYATGENNGFTRSHLDSTFVLGFLGVAAVVAAGVVASELSARRKAPAPHRSDHDDA